jgi:large subunit ribosomal protein L29
MTRPEQLRDKSDVDLKNRERELSEQLFKLRFQKATGGLENPMKIRQARREIARIRTILRERAGAVTASAGK